MELKHVLLTILKILISTVLILQQVGYADGAAMMGGHLDNKNHTQDDQLYDEYDYTESGEVPAEKTTKIESKTDSEEIPDPSPLVLPGYNLPESIFNHGKPFYVEKDPLTGKIDFDHKSPSLKPDEGDLYDYVNDDVSDNVYDKKNIDRKDGSLVSYSSHKQADINQLTPNFHDFLNLPVKYNPDKYVYPLISNSYASTKIQGSVNKFHNHKDTFGIQKTTTTKKPISNPSYYTTTSYYTARTTQRTMATTPVTTTTTKPVTVKRYPELTTTPANILNSGMSHPSFNEEYEYYDSPSETTASTTTTTTTTKKPKPQDIYLTTQSVKKVYESTKSTTAKPTSTTTKRVMSLFEQLFGDYDETVTTTEATKPPSLFSNLPSSTTTVKTTSKPISLTTTTQSYYPNIHAGPHINVMTGSNMGLDNSYEYTDEDYSNERIQDNIAVENKIHNKIEDNLSVEPLKPVTKLTPVNKTIYEDKNRFGEKKPILDLNKNKPFSVKPSNYGDYVTEKPKYVPSTTSTTTTTTIRPFSTTKPTTYRPSTTITTSPTTSRVTSLPLGENHISSPSLNRDPIIVATQNLREKLNSEKVTQESPQLIVQLPPQPQDSLRPITQLVPSSSNIHIAPGQDTVSFVVGHHQSVGDGGQYVGTALKESPFDNKPFRPLYGDEGTYSANLDNNRPQIDLKPSQVPEVAGSAVTIQSMQNSEASLAIGIPVNGIKQVPGQVMDASLDHDGHIQFPKAEGNKVVFPDDEKPIQSNLIPPRPEPQQQPPPPPQLPNREILKLSSKPVYHQLPSDLTPPKENDVVALPPRFGPSDRPMRPPWDPRPGHFYSGKPEYNRPPRPPPDVAYKRIDNLPNILPQFRPNTKHHYPMGPPPPPPYMYNRQPLLERPSNRPIGFFEKMGPPPPPNLYKRYPQKNLIRGPPPPMHNFEERRPLPPQALKPNFDIEERRPLAQQPHQSLDENQNPMAEDRIMNEPPRRPELVNNNAPELSIYQTPPNIHIANRRNGDGDVEVETLQMIQAKNEKGKETVEKPEDIDEAEEEEVEIKGDTVKVTAEEPEKEINSDKTIYKVYPVNTAPIIDVDRKEGVVMGSRGDSPLPPSKVNNDFNYQLKDRKDAPILKPHPRPPTFPVKSDFPYPLERPDSIRQPDSPNNKLDDVAHEPYFNNQWNSVGENLESRIVSGGKINYGSNQISATLKTYTEKPIAIAYTPTEPNLNADKYSMPNYGSPVIPEIRPGTVENVETGYGSKNSEFTVHATMHANPNYKMPPRAPAFQEPPNHKFNHKVDVDVDSDPVPPQLDFQAPFQASVKLDAAHNQGWSVVREKNRTSTVEETEATTVPLATTSEFDIENFKPQLIGGFKPLYSMPDVEGRKSEDVPEREEK